MGDHISDPIAGSADPRIKIGRIYFNAIFVGDGQPVGVIAGIEDINVNFLVFIENSVGNGEMAPDLFGDRDDLIGVKFIAFIEDHHVVLGLDLVFSKKGLGKKNP